MSESEIKDLLNTPIKEIDQELARSAQGGKGLVSQEYWKYDGSYASVEWAIKGRDGYIHLKHKHPRGQEDGKDTTLSLIKTAEAKIPKYLHVKVYPPRPPETYVFTLKILDFTSVIANHPSFLKEISEHISNNWKI